MFVLARHLSGSSAGAVVAGIVSSFAPYRFEHYMHMELQWAVWLPWAFWALQRTIETGAAKYGALTGVFAALQLLSSMYYAAFLALLLPAVAVLQLIPHNRRDALAILRGLVIGATIAGGASAMYATPYTRTSARVGVRSETEVMTFSAKPKDYLAATSEQPLLRRAIAWTSRAAALPWNTGAAARPVRTVAADTDVRRRWPIWSAVSSPSSSRWECTVISTRSYTTMSILFNRCEHRRAHRSSFCCFSAFSRRKDSRPFPRPGKGRWRLASRHRSHPLAAGRVLGCAGQTGSVSEPGACAVLLARTTAARHRRGISDAEHMRTCQDVTRSIRTCQRSTGNPC